MQELPLYQIQGHELVVLALKENLPIIPIPGPSAIIAALVASGLSSEKFFFCGVSFPQKKTKKLIH